MQKAKVIRQITKGDWFVRGIQRVDEEKGEIYFSASGVNKNEDQMCIRDSTYPEEALQKIKDGSDLISFPDTNWWDRCV